MQLRRGTLIRPRPASGRGEGTTPGLRARAALLALSCVPAFTSCRRGPVPYLPDEVSPPGGFRRDVHVTRPGDTLASLSAWYGIPVGILVVVNRFAPGEEPAPGDRLVVPSYSEVYPWKRAVEPSPGRRRHRSVGRLVWPVLGGRITSLFGRRGGRRHAGVDIAAPEGSPVFASHGGTVVASGRSSGGYGEVVKILGDGLVTLYAHNSRRFVAEGDVVEAGDPVAAVGSTGRASGPHCHFEVRPADAGEVVDPLFFFTPPG